MITVYNGRLSDIRRRESGMSIHESGENYLESRRLGRVRAVDICAALGFSKPTVSIAMKKLREDGFVLTDENGYLTLTESGLAIAERIFDRHNTLAEMLMEIGVSRETAYADACKIEHDISDESFELIKAHLKNTKI